jgi:predicted secreted protein
MSITSALVLFAVIWFLVMFVTLPIGLRTQGDENEVVPGTQAGAPANFRLKRTVVIVTLVTAVIWTVVFAVITSGWISVRDFDVRNVMGGQ